MSIKLRGALWGCVLLGSVSCGGAKHPQSASASPPLTPTIQRCVINSDGSVVAVIDVVNRTKQELHFGEGEAAPPGSGSPWSHEYSLSWTSPEFLYGSASSGTFLKTQPPVATAIGPGGHAERWLALTETGVQAQGDVQVGLFWHDGTSDDPEELVLRNSCSMLTIESDPKSCRVVASTPCPDDT